VTTRPLDAARDALIAAQAQLIVMPAERNSALEARIGESEDRLARLERAVTRNSGNSGMAPSSDDLPGRAAPEPKPERGNGKKKQGKQKGAPGAHLAWSENPDEKKALFPQGLCCCGNDLDDAADLWIAASASFSV
jgi:transposase